MSGRLGIGIACGLFTGLVPLYITEVAPVHLRGGLGTFNQLAVTSGILLRFVDVSVFTSMVFTPVKKRQTHLKNEFHSKTTQVCKTEKGCYCFSSKPIILWSVIMLTFVSTNQTP